VLLFSKVKSKFAPLTVRFEGPDSAIDAVVSVTDGSGKRFATRHLYGGDGRNIQTTPEARFALAPGKYRVEVKYSSGQTRSKDVTLADKPVWESIGK
jgi:hypothetical protein